MNKNIILFLYNLHVTSDVLNKTCFRGENNYISLSLLNDNDIFHLLPAIILLKFKILIEKQTNYI